MLKFQQAQLSMFARPAELAFEAEMAAHLAGFAPLHVEALGEAGARRVVRLGMERAAQHGFTRRGPVRLYIELMFLLGGAFATDPLLPWAGKVLWGGGDEDQMERAARLHAGLLDYIERVVGKDRGFAVGAARRLGEALARREGFPPAGGVSEGWALATLRWIHPQQCAYLGDAPLREIVLRARPIAERCGLATERGVALTLALMFAVGHGFAEDPVHPWIEATLRDPELDTAERRVVALERQMKRRIDRVVSQFERERGRV